MSSSSKTLTISIDNFEQPLQRIDSPRTVSKL